MPHSALPLPVKWPPDADWNQSEATDHLKYHGISALLADQGHDLPSEVKEHVRAQAMWEMRHRIELEKLLASLARRNVRHALLKGTALAYGYYSAPHHRSRGDTDILIDTTSLVKARATLAELDFEKATSGPGNQDFDYQESWTKRTPDRLLHVVDLHWQVMNGAALQGILPVEECLINSVDLPTLCKEARSLPAPYLLVHACLHRLMHRTAPYFIGRSEYLGSDRLIWAMDIKLLVEALTSEGQETVIELSEKHGIAGIVLDGLKFAQAAVGLETLPELEARLSALPIDDAISRFFLISERRGRAWRNFMAGRSWEERTHRAFRMLLPSASVVRARYPRATNWPLWTLYARRLSDFILSRHPKT